jgi:hypothetical protein
MIESWEPQFPSAHLIFGQHYASSLERFHKFRAEGLSFDEALHTVVLRALRDTWIDGKPWESMHNAKTRENLIRSIVWYIDTFENDPLQTVILIDGKAAAEYSFLLEVDNGILFSGHIDRVVTMGPDYYLTDNKTTGHTITRHYFEQFDMSLQMSMYTFAGQATYNLPIKGVIIDAAQIAVGFTSFERGMTYRTNEQLDEWYEDMMRLIHNTRQMTAEGYFPMNVSSCDKFGGCEFRHVCSKPKSLRDNFLRADFRKRIPWNPMERR